MISINAVIIPSNTDTLLKPFSLTWYNLRCNASLSSLRYDTKFHPEKEVSRSLSINCGFLNQFPVFGAGSFVLTVSHLHGIIYLSMLRSGSNGAIEIRLSIPIGWKFVYKWNTRDGWKRRSITKLERLFKEGLSRL